jgi:hypothetical protein
MLHIQVSEGASVLKQVALAIAGISIVAGHANADVVAKAPDGFVLRFVAEARLDRDAAWAKLVDIGSWWSGSHTYSGDAKSLGLDAQAGGCWCEIWSGGEVEHGRVVMVMPLKTLRVNAALGPLQGMGVQATLTFTLDDSEAEGKTKLTIEYKVNGSSLSGLDQVASGVDAVLKEQVTRLAAGA